jgi:hypothetical protein
MGILQGKNILVTGVLTDSSIAFHIAKLAQEEGATVLLSSYGRVMSLTTRIAGRLPQSAPVIELDVTNQEHLDALAVRVREHVPHLDGVVHSIGFAPEAALGGNFLNTGLADVTVAGWIYLSNYDTRQFFFDKLSNTPGIYPMELAITSANTLAYYCGTSPNIELVGNSVLNQNTKQTRSPGGLIQISLLSGITQLQHMQANRQRWSLAKQLPADYFETARSKSSSGIERP